MTTEKTAVQVMAAAPTVGQGRKRRNKPSQLERKVKHQVEEFMDILILLQYQVEELAKLHRSYNPRRTGYAKK